MNLYFFRCLPDCVICAYVTARNFTERVERDLSLPITHLTLPSSWCSPAHLVEKRRSHWNRLGRHTGMAPRQFASSSSFPIRQTKLHLMRRWSSRTKLSKKWPKTLPGSLSPNLANTRLWAHVSRSGKPYVFLLYSTVPLVFWLVPLYN